MTTVVTLVDPTASQVVVFGNVLTQLVPTVLLQTADVLYQYRMTFDGQPSTNTNYQDFCLALDRGSVTAVVETQSVVNSSQLKTILDSLISSGFVLPYAAPSTAIATISQSPTFANGATGLPLELKAQSALGPDSVGGDLRFSAGVGTRLDSQTLPTGGRVYFLGHSHAFGPDSATIPSGEYSFAWGLDSQATSTFAVSMGAHCRATSAGAVALGESCIAEYANAVAIGWNNTVSAYGAFGAGMYLQIVAGAEGAFVCGVSATARHPGEFTHGSGIAAKVGFTNIGRREIDVGVRANAAPATCKMRNGQELTLQEFCYSTIEIRISAGTTGFGKLASEIATLAIKTTSGSISTIVGGVAMAPIGSPGQSFVSQGWSVAITVTGKTLRITCNPGGDDVEFFARVDIMDQAL